MVNPVSPLHRIALIVVICAATTYARMLRIVRAMPSPKEIMRRACGLFCNAASNGTRLLGVASLVSWAGPGTMWTWTVGMPRLAAAAAWIRRLCSPPSPIAVRTDAAPSRPRHRRPRSARPVAPARPAAPPAPMLGGRATRRSPASAQRRRHPHRADARDCHRPVWDAFSAPGRTRHALAGARGGAGPGHAHVHPPGMTSPEPAGSSSRHGQAPVMPRLANAFSRGASGICAAS